MELFVAAVVIALGVSFVCSLLEATLLSLTPSQMADISAQHPAAGRVWKRFKTNIEQPIAVILILNTTAHTIGASIAGAKFEDIWGGQWLFAFSLALTYVMLQFTEILPKTLGVAHNRSLAVVIARPLAGLVTLFTPFLKFVHWVNRPFERRKDPESAGRIIEEIRALALVAQTTNSIDPQQSRMIEAAARLPSLVARQIGTPRPEVTYLTLGQPLAEILSVFQKSPFTRLPLCDGTIDKVVGMIHVRDLFNHLHLVPGKLRFSGTGPADGATIAIADGEPGSEVHVIGAGEIDLTRIMRHVLFIPATTPVPQLLEQFRDSRIHMAVMVDEYGATVGVVTLEDIIEEMVGEIHDEFDPTPVPDVVEKDGVVRVRARVAVRELAQQLRIPLDDEGIDTLGGYVVQHLGRFPEVGDVVPIGPFEAKVISLERRRIGMLELRRVVPADPEASTP